MESYYSWIVLLLCILNFVTWRLCTRKMTIKQKAYFLSVKNSIILSALSIYFNIKHYIWNKNSEPLETFAILYFTSYLLSDLVIGNACYPDYMKSLSGNAHHIVYLIVNTLAIVTHNTAAYMLLFLEEVPTVILSLGSFDKTYRSDKLFGVTFFIFRILFHICMMWYFRNNTLIRNLSIPIFFLHVYWFYKWTKKYSKSKQS